MPSLSPGVSHPVALVPLTEENEDAMENRTFQKLLRSVGIRAPTDGQVGLGFFVLIFSLTPNVCHKYSLFFLEASILL